MISVLDQALQVSTAIDKAGDKNPEVQEATALAKRASEAREKASGELEALRPKYEAAEKALSEPLPKAPDLKTPGGPPKSADYIKDPTRVFGQFMPMLVAFGSLATRRGGINAIRAAAKAMDAAKANDREALEFAHQEWVDQTKATLDANDQMLKQFDAIVQNRNLGLAEKSRLLEVFAAEHNITDAQALLAGGRLDDFTKVMNLKKGAADPIRQIYEQAQTNQRERERIAQEHSDRMADMGERRQEHQDSLAFDRENMDPARKAYNDHLRAHPGDEAGALEALRKTAIAETPGKTSAGEDKLRTELLKRGGPGAAFQAIKENATKLKEAARNPEAYINPAGTAIVADTFTRAFNGGNAIRGFQAKMLADDRSLKNNLQSILQRASNGGKFTPQEIRQMSEAVLRVEPMLRGAYTDALGDAQRLARERGYDPQAIVPFGLGLDDTTGQDAGAASGDGWKVIKVH